MLVESDSGFVLPKFCVGSSPELDSERRELLAEGRASIDWTQFLQMNASKKSSQNDMCALGSDADATEPSDSLGELKHRT